MYIFLQNHNMFLIGFSISAMRLMSSESQKFKIISEHQKVKKTGPEENNVSAKDSVHFMQLVSVMV